MRIGIGYDTHALAKGRPLIIGGVHFAFEMGLEGYSDADVLVHAIMDALLGAACLKDIGNHFPSTDPRYENASSINLLKEVGTMVASRGYHIVNIDCVLIAQAPKIANATDAMRYNIAAALRIDSNRVMVKATTTDGLGFTGRSEGMSAQAVALLEE